MLVQIYEIGDPEEGRAVAALGVDHVGVPVGTGAFPRERRPQQARAIFAVLPSRVKRVALSLAADPAAIARVIEETAPDIVHSAPRPSASARAKAPASRPATRGVKLMRSIPVVDESSIAFAKAREGIADFLLLDSHAPGDAQIGALGRTHDWRISRRIVESVAVPAILAGGLGPENARGDPRRYTRRRRFENQNGSRRRLARERSREGARVRRGGEGAKRLSTAQDYLRGGARQIPLPFFAKFRGRAKRLYRCDRDSRRESPRLHAKGNAMKIPPQTAPALWGAAGGAALIALLGFTWFGWVTSSTAERQAKQQTETALVTALTPVCVEKFKESADAAKNFEALNKIEYSWEKGSFVQKGGWATPPGAKEPNAALAQACAEALGKQKL